MFTKSELHKFAIIVVLILLLLGAYFVLVSLRGPDRTINSFEDCVRAGNPVMESYPRQCRTEDGRLFVEEIDEPAQVPEEGDNNSGDIPGGGDREDVVGRLPGAYDGCVITGCSGQVCADSEVFTTCEYRPEYACYEEAVCERQADDECGWTETSELQACLARF